MTGGTPHVMTFDPGPLNTACLDAFGQAYTLTYSLTAESRPVTGILCSAAEAEASAPGDGSAYARFWLQAGDVDPVPVEGDEISSATTVYKVVRRERDEAGGLWLLLRQDRGA